MSSPFDVLLPQTPPEPRGARLVQGSCQSACRDDLRDRNNAAISTAAAVAPRGTSEYRRAYDRVKKREARQRKRDRMPLSEKYAPPSFTSLAHTRGVFRKR